MKSALILLLFLVLVLNASVTRKTLSWQVTKSSPVNVTAEIERVQDKRDYVIATLNWKHVEFLLNCLPLHLHLQKIW